MSRYAASQESRRLRGRLASVSIAGDPASIANARREFRVSRLADHITHALNEQPTLTSEQRKSLARLILGKSGAR